MATGLPLVRLKCFATHPSSFVSVGGATEPKQEAILLGATPHLIKEG